MRALPSRSAGAGRWRALTLVALVLLALGLVDCHFLGVDCPEGEHYYACAVYGCCAHALGCICPQPGCAPDTVYICATSEAEALVDGDVQQLVRPPNEPGAHVACFYSTARPPPPTHPEGEGGSDVCGAGAGGKGAGGDGFGGSSDIGTGVGAGSDVGGVGAGPSSSADVGAGPGGGFVRGWGAGGAW